MTEELAKASKKTKTVRDLIQGEAFKHQIALALPRHITPDRFVRITHTAVTRKPELTICDPGSFFLAVMTLSQLGLEPDGRLAHLIPFKNKKKGITECQLIVDYKGLAALAMRSGQLIKVHADKVCQKDIFKYTIGEVKEHEINWKEDRGEPYAYYALVVFKDGGAQKADCMTKAEVDAIRKRSRAAEDGPWVTDYDEMAKKTVFRRLSKWLELSPEYRDAMEADWDRPVTGMETEVIPQFDIPQGVPEKVAEREENKSERGLAAKSADPLTLLIAKLKEHGVPEKAFCQGLSLLGYDLGDIETLDEIPMTLLKQIVTMDMGKLLDEMEAKANK